MARASTSRIAAKPSRSQPRPNLSQRVHRSARRGDSEEDDEDEAMQDTGNPMEIDSEPEATQGRRGADNENANDITRAASNLVRLALFTEHKRIPLKREDITKKVLGSNTRSFNMVLELAQKMLRKTFGMELVELKTRADLEKATANNTNDDLDDTRNATGVKKRATASGSKTYILRSVLDPVIIEFAALTDELILEEEAVDELDDNDDDDDATFGNRSYGSIISWSRADQLGPVGLLYVILALILVSGRVMNEGDLRANLKRLRLPPTSSVSFNQQATHKSQPVDAYLTQLIRQGYLDRQRVGDKKGAGAKRGRVSAATQGEGGEDVGTWEWRWGSRAQSEVGETGVASFVAEFMVERMGDDEMDEDEDEGGGKGKGKGKGRAKQKVGNAQKRMTNMMKGIERAAGGSLAELQ